MQGLEILVWLLHGSRPSWVYFTVMLKYYPVIWIRSRTVCNEEIGSLHSPSIRVITFMRALLIHIIRRPPNHVLKKLAQTPCRIMELLFMIHLCHHGSLHKHLSANAPKMPEEANWFRLQRCKRPKAPSLRYSPISRNGDLYRETIYRPKTKDLDHVTLKRDPNHTTQEAKQLKEYEFFGRYSTEYGTPLKQQ